MVDSTESFMIACAAITAVFGLGYQIMRIIRGIKEYIKQRENEAIERHELAETIKELTILTKSNQERLKQIELQSKELDQRLKDYEQRTANAFSELNTKILQIEVKVNMIETGLNGHPRTVIGNDPHIKVIP